MNFSNAFNATKQWKPSCINLWKNAFYGLCSNKIVNSLMGSFSKVQNIYNNDPIVEFESFGQNSLEYWTYVSSPWPWAITLIKMTESLPKLETFFLHSKFKRIILEWSILSWMTQRYPSWIWLI
jgi:hypothetical protein